MKEFHIVKNVTSTSFTSMFNLFKTVKFMKVKILAKQKYVEKSLIKNVGVAYN